MNTEYLNRMMWQAQYHLKPDTAFSYLHKDFLGIADISDNKERKAHTIQMIQMKASSGKEMLLPIRLAFIKGDMINISHTGRGSRNKIRQMKGYYTKPEISPYKLYPPYQVNTSIWQVDGYKTLYYGSVGINLAEGQHTRDNGDLILFFTTDWTKVDVFIFKGLYNPNNEANLMEVADFVYNIIKG